MSERREAGIPPSRERGPSGPAPKAPRAGEMSEQELTEEDVARMATPLWERARAAFRQGRPEEGDRLLDAAVAQWQALQDYSINWVASLLTFVGEELGEPAVERALRKTGDEYVRPRRDGTDWNALPASTRARAIARAMVANMSSVDVSEDDDKIVLAFRCGTGGRLIDEGRYEGDAAYLTLHEREGRTFMRDALPVYCAHCAVNNEIQPVEWTGVPTTIEHPPEHPGEPCIHHVYKDAAAVPTEVYERLGKRAPTEDPPT